MGVTRPTRADAAAVAAEQTTLLRVGLQLPLFLL